MDTGPSLNTTVHFYSCNVLPTLTHGEPLPPYFPAIKHDIINLIKMHSRLENQVVAKESQ